MEIILQTLEWSEKLNVSGSPSKQSTEKTTVANSAVINIVSFSMGFPGGSEGASWLQWGRSGFDPQVRKIPWRRKWQPTLLLLPGKFHGQRNLVGLFLLWFPQGIFPIVGLLDHMVVLFLGLKGTAILFFLVAVSICIPIKSEKGFPFSTPSPAFIVCRLFVDGHSDWCKMIPLCSFR